MILESKVVSGLREWDGVFDVCVYDGIVEWRGEGLRCGYEGMIWEWWLY